jgi:hypothetical protein
MKKLIFVFWRKLAVYNGALISQALYSFGVLALVFFPCFAHSASFDWRGEIQERVVISPYFLEGCVPDLEDLLLRGIPVNIMQQKAEAVIEGALSENVTSIPVQSNGDENPNKRTEKTGEDYTCIHPFLFSLQLFIGALIGIPISWFIFLTFMGHLEHIFSINTLRKWKVPKWFYNDSVYF